MNYHGYYPIDVVNGPGTRCTLFVSGCIHKCKGCYNATTWRPDSGQPYSEELEDRIITDLCCTRIPRRGLSLTGGDPLYPENVPVILKLVQRVRACCPDKDIWLWSGYVLEELTMAQSAVIQMIDVLVDGKYHEDQRDPSLVWSGSRNQRIHYLNLLQS